jgi:hypothetical protein
MSKQEVLAIGDVGTGQGCCAPINEQRPPAQTAAVLAPAAANIVGTMPWTVNQ